MYNFKELGGQIVCWGQLKGGKCSTEFLSEELLWCEDVSVHWIDTGTRTIKKGLRSIIATEKNILIFCHKKFSFILKRASVWGLA